MHTINHPSQRVWYIAHSGGSIFHYGFVCPNTRMDSEHQTLEQFTTEEDMLIRLSELGCHISSDTD